MEKLIIIMGNHAIFINLWVNKADIKLQAFTKVLKKKVNTKLMKRTKVLHGSYEYLTEFSDT